MEIILSVLYTIIFISIIYYSRFFKNSEIGIKLIVIIYITKIITGVLLNLIYTYCYQDKETSDVYKYFYDSKPIYEALKVNPLHFFQLIFGFHDNADYLKVYTSKTTNWLNSTKEYLKYSDINDNDFFNSHKLITKFNAIIRIFSFSYLTVHVVFMNFISLVGQTLIFKTFYPFLKNKKYELITIIFLIPSVLFWSSGVLKESIVIFGLGLFLFSVFKIINNFSISILFFTFFSLLIICISKYYILIALIPAIVAYLLVFYTKKNIIFFKYLLVLTVFAIILSLIGLISPKYNCLNILADKQSDLIRNSKGGNYFIQYLNGKENVIYFSSETEIHAKIFNKTKKYLKLLEEIPYKLYNNGEENKTYYTKNDSSYYYLLYSSKKSGSYYEIPKLQTDLISLLKNIPFALFNILFRPFIFQKHGIFALISGIENIIILLIAIFCLIFRNKSPANTNLIIFNLTFVIISYLLIGLTTPVEGAMVRYKIVALPFFLIIFLLILDKDKIVEKFK